MKPEAVRAFLFGVLAVLCGYLLFANFEPDTVHFLARLRGNRNYHLITSFDRLLPLAALTVLCGFFAIRSLIGALRKGADVVAQPASSNEPRSAERAFEPASDPRPSWTCPDCGEDNPGTFNECWKCQRLRAEEESA
jgi:hypothetical protein